MTQFLPTHAQQWQPIDVRGVPIEACRLWEGDHNVEAGLYRLPQGLTIPCHRHLHWCQVFVVRGVMQVLVDGEDPHTIDAGGYYFVEPGDTHTETALTDSLLLVTCEEDRPSFRRGLQQGWGERAAPSQP
ncbi:MAG: cupin domain-containing protein [Vulcanococcus sp.]|jgi:quercetin dioxygenase-like cupin family protein